MVRSWVLLGMPTGDIHSPFLRSVFAPCWYRVSRLSFFTGACFGLSDALNNTQAFALLGDEFPEPDENVKAFTIFQLLQNAGMAAGFAFSLLVPIDWPHRWLIFGVQLAMLLSSACRGVVNEREHYLAPTDTATRRSQASSCCDCVPGTPPRFDFHTTAMWNAGRD